MSEVNLIPEEYKKNKRNFLALFFSKTGIIFVILLIVGLLLFGGLLAYKGGLNKKINNIKQTITELDQKRDSKLEEEIIKLDRKINLVEGLFKNHLYWSKVFEKLEQLTVPEIYFSGAKINLLEEKINIDFSGIAQSYNNIARQMVSFKEDELVEKIEVSTLSLNEKGGIDFELVIILSKEAVLNLIN